MPLWKAFFVDGSTERNKSSGVTAYVIARMSGTISKKTLTVFFSVFKL